MQIRYTYIFFYVYTSNRMIILIPCKFQVANFMAVEDLLDSCCRKIASMIRGKCVEEIRKLFNIENDFTPEEEEEIREESRWAFWWRCAVHWTPCFLFVLLFSVFGYNPWACECNCVLVLGSSRAHRTRLKFSLISVVFVGPGFSS